MITAATLGLVLAAEEVEPDAMEKPPRVQGKPLLGKQITWRALFVGTLLIVAMLGQQAWTRALGGSEARGLTVAMNVLVISQCLYCLSCRSLSANMVSFRAWVENPWLTGMVILNGALQALITYAPGVTDVFGTAPLTGLDWVRVLVTALVIFLLVELEKKLGPYFVRPVVIPVIRWFSRLCGCARARGPQPYRMTRDQIAEAAAPTSAVNHGGVGIELPAAAVVVRSTSTRA